MQLFLCVVETILVFFYFVLWVLLSFQSFVICHLAIAAIQSTQRNYHNSTWGGGGGRPQLCGLSYLLLFRVGTVSDPLVGTWCFGFPTYHKAIFEIISRKIDKSFGGVVTILKFVFEGVLL